MATHQELLRLNHDIEVLENAGFIKAASVLHKKFIKEAQAQSYVANSGVLVTKPENTNNQTPPAQTQPPAQNTVQPSLPPNYDPYQNYYQDPRTGRTVFVDPGTGQPFQNQQGLPTELGKGLPVTPPGTYQNPGGGTYTVPNPGMNINPTPAPINPPYEGSFTNPGGQNVPPPTQPPSFPPPGNENNQIPGLEERYGFYFQKINDGYGLPQDQQQAYFDRIKQQLFDQLQKGLIDQKTYNDLMRLFSGK